jgi:GNAT superfamily N-acetyltransferase
MEENDNCFTAIWSNPRKLDCGTLFLNSELPGDIFFNKLTNVTCLSDIMITESIIQLKQYGSNPYIYSLNFPDFENQLKKKGFNYYDTQHVLKKSSVPTKIPIIKKIAFDEIPFWTSIFCKAYDCIDWTDSINSILKNSHSLADYYVDESNSSCMVLYETKSILGLYCLGTIPNRRRQGFAASMIDFALLEVSRRNLECLMLEVFQRDGLIDFYSNLGFEKVYQKTVYTI